MKVGEPDFILFPIGGGGLASGTLLAAKYFCPKAKRIGVEPELAKDAYLSLQQNKIHPQLPPKTIADGLRTSLGSLTFPLIRDNIEDVVLVTEKEIIDAMRLVFERMKIVIEASSATVVAAVMKDPKRYAGKKVTAIISGGNVDFTDYFSNLEKIWVPAASKL
jgi:threonine dehydratase